MAPVCQKTSEAPGMETIKRQTKAMYGRMAAGQSPCVRAWLRLHMRLAVLYKC